MGSDLGSKGVDLWFDEGFGWGGGGGRVEIFGLADGGGGAADVVTENDGELVGGGLVEEAAFLAIGGEGADVVG